jgi:hypothetical protein
MQQARDRLADAEAILGTAHPAVVVSAAYYGVLSLRSRLRPMQGGCVQIVQLSSVESGTYFGTRFG